MKSKQREYGNVLYTLCPILTDFLHLFFTQGEKVSTSGEQHNTLY